MKTEEKFELLDIWWHGLKLSDQLSLFEERKKLLGDDE